MINKKKPTPWPVWEAKTFAGPDCIADGTGAGERLLMGIGIHCARYYPEHYDKFILRFNAEKCKPPFKGRELIHKIKECRRLAGLPVSSRSHTGGSGYRPTKLRFDPNMFSKAYENKVVTNVTESYLWWKSPIVPDAQSPTSVLGHIYEEGEKIFVTDTLDRKEPSELVTIAPVMHYPKLERFAQNNEAGVWFLPNPVSGQWTKSDSGALSLRCANAVTSFRYCVIESDEVSVDKWLNFICHCDLPVVAIYKSGGKSIHAIIKVNAQSREEWEYNVSADKEVNPKSLKSIFVPLGADAAMFHLQQPCRLPQCWRHGIDKDGKPYRRLQQLLYLNPNPDNTPIVKMPLRETREAIQARMSESLKMLGEDSESFPKITIPDGGTDGN